MKKFLTFLPILFLSAICYGQSPCDALYIKGVIDATLPGGEPKGVQFCANDDILDLSTYGFGSANNGDGTDGEEFTFPAISICSGECFWVSFETVEFVNWFECSPEYTSAAAQINGDDAIELFCSGNLVDLYGDQNVDGNGECWEYLDSHAYRNNTIQNAGVFSCANWTIAGANALDNNTSNMDAPSYPTPCSCDITITVAATETACDTGTNPSDPADDTFNVTVTATTGAGPNPAVLFSDEFDYPDGSLVPMGGWANHSGTMGDMQVVSGEVVVQHGTPSEDANNSSFAGVAGDIYYGIDFYVPNPGGPIPGTDNEYFIHFKDNGFNFCARMDIVPALSGGDFSVGISSDGSVADAIWPIDLIYGTTYRAIVRYNQNINQAELWINATVDTDPSILGDDRPDPGDAVTQIALRQSDSNLNEAVHVDNLIVGSTFESVLEIVNPADYEITDGTTTWGPFVSGEIGTAGPFTADGVFVTGDLKIISAGGVDTSPCSEQLGSFGPVASCSASTCLMENVSITAMCDNGDAILTVTYDITDGGGVYELVALTSCPSVTAGTVLGTINGPATGVALMGTMTIDGPTPGCSLMVAFRDAADGFCTQDNIPLIIPQCDPCSFDLGDVTTTCNVDGTFDLEVCFTHNNPINPNAPMATIEVGSDLDCTTASMSSTIATMDGVEVCETFTGLTDGDGTNGTINIYDTNLDLIAFTSFEEIDLSVNNGIYIDTGDPSMDHDLVNNPGQMPVDYVAVCDELGFDASYVNSRNNVGLTDGDFVGVTNFTGTVGSFTNGVQGYEIQDADGTMVLTFDEVDYGVCSSAEMCLDYFIQNTGYEADDLLHIFAEYSDMSTSDLILYGESELEANGGSWNSMCFPLTGPSPVSLVFSFESNSGVEAVYFDNIQFKGNGCESYFASSCNLVAQYEKPICCGDQMVTAVAVCNDGTSDAVLGEYFVEVEITNIGTANTVDLTADGINVTSTGVSTLGVGVGTYVFGPFTHSNTVAGTNGVVDVTMTNSDVAECEINLEVSETFCGFDPTGDVDGMGPFGGDEPLHSSGFICACLDDAITPVTLLSQSEPGTFIAGGTSGLLQVYVLADEFGEIIAVNNSGYFGPNMTMFPDGIYTVYAINITEGDWATIAGQLVVGANYDTVVSDNPDLCSATCSTMFDIDCNCCAPDAGTQSLDPAQYCGDSNGLAPMGAVAEISVDFTSLPAEPLPNQYSYAWVITSPTLQIINVIESDNYNVGAPEDFTDMVPLQDEFGNMLPVGQYCIHGINYLDGDLPLNQGNPQVLTIAILQSLIGGNAGGVATSLFENDGVLTGNEQFCADLNLMGCTPVVINPTPEIVANPENFMVCEGGDAIFCASATVADTGDPDNVTSPLIFELQTTTAAGGWVTVQTDNTDLGGVAGAIVERCFTVEDVTADMNCDSYRVKVTAAHSPVPRCSVESDRAKLIIHTETQITCNNKVNVSATSNCEFNFNAISFLEGERDKVCGIDATDYYDMFYEVFYLTPGGVRLAEGDDISAFAGQCLDYEVVDVCFETSCWGTVCIEDKILPTLEDCGCEVQGSSDRDDYAEICRLKCYQKDLIQNGIESVLTCDYLPYPRPMDNCQTYPAPFRNLEDLAWTDEWIEGECGQWWLQRTFNLFTEVYNEQRGVFERIVADECVFEFFVDSYGVGPQDTIGLNTIDEFAAITDQQVLANTLFLPVAVIELGCGIDPTPAYLASLASGLDLPMNPAPSGDNTTTVGDINVEEANEGIPYGYPFYMAKGWACGSHPQRIAPEVCNIIVDYTDQLLETCGPDCKGNEKTLREWTILDWCAGEVIYWNQLIKTVDTEAPTMSVQNITVSVDPWKCSADAVMPLPDFLHDNCDDRLVSYLVTNVEGIDVSGDMSTGFVAHDLAKTMPGEPHEFFYEVLDCCGNGAQYMMTVTVVDLTAPTPVTLQNIVLSLTSLNPDTSGIAKIFAEDIDNGSYDECSGVHLEIRRATDACGFLGNTTFNNDGHAEDDKDDPDGGQYVKFCCDDLEDDGTGVMKGVVDVVLRVWDDADMNGEYGTAGDNYNESWSTVTIEDKLGGSPQCPPNLVLTCDMSKDDLSMTGVPGPTILTCMTTPVDSAYSDIPKLKRPTDAMELNGQIAPWFPLGAMPPFDPVCRIGAIERTWAACGVQWILFVDNGERFDEETIDYPEDEIVECAEFAEGEPTWNEVSCQLIGYSVESDTFNFEQGACYKVLNRYTVINWCEYDPSDPDILDPGSDDGIVPGIWSKVQEQKLIDDTNPTLEYTGETCFAVNGTCTSDEITLEMVGDDSGDCASPWLKWEVVIDLWGDGTPDHTFTSFTTTNNPFYLAPTARGESLSVVIPEGVDVSKNNHPVYITVSDGCGNVMSQVVDIEITDKKKPTPYCLNLSTALMANGGVELWACDFNAGSFDNCTPQSWLRYTFSAVNPDTLNDTPGLDEIYDPLTQCSGRVFTDADIVDADLDGLIDVDVYVWDECGNYDFCTVKLRLIDNLGARASIEGDIRTEEGQEVRDVEVRINSSTPEYPASSMTDGNGHYAFGDNPMYLNYNISGEKNDNYLNGVSTLDLVLIQRHILGLKKLNSAYKMIAADVNSDQGISTIDLIELRKLILGIYAELPENNSWRFVVEAMNMEPTNPWPFVEEIDIFSLNQNMMEENYVGVKIGDVNGSVELSAKAHTAVYTRIKDLELMIDAQSYEAGDRVEMAVRSSNFEEISGYQFTMELNNLKLLEVVSGAVNMDMSNVAQLDANTVTVSWNDKVGVTADKDEVLFSLIYEAQESGNTSVTAINSSVTKAEAYAGSAYETMGVSLRNGLKVSKLHQNEPNPFSSTTLIGFELAESGSVSLKLTDVTGKLLKQVQANYNSGYNTIEIDARDLGLGGVMYYTLESGDFVSTKKMVVIK